MKLGEVSLVRTPIPVSRSPIGHVLDAVGPQDKRIRDALRDAPHIDLQQSSGAMSRCPFGGTARRNRHWFRSTRVLQQHA
jgi:hypothetical protein